MAKYRLTDQAAERVGWILNLLSLVAFTVPLIGGVYALGDASVLWLRLIGGLVVAVYVLAWLWAVFGWPIVERVKEDNG